VTQILRDSLNDMDLLYVKKHEEGMDRLRNDSNWAQLEPEQRNNLLEKKQLTLLFKPQINVQTTTDIIKTLTRMSLTMMKDRIEALSGRFDQVLQAAAEEMEPEVQFVQISRPTLKTEAEIENWITSIGKKLKEALVNGPVVMK